MMPASSPARHRADATASAEVTDNGVDARRADLVALSHDIHAEPELAFAEHRSCAKTQTLVAERGFAITASPAGLDTAFRADYGSGDLVIAVCAEYDALPGIGHACGHNIIAASAVGSALALAEGADELGLTVALTGTPPSRRTSGSTPPTRSPSRRSRSGCCVSSLRPASRCTGSSPMAARPPT